MSNTRENGNDRVFLITGASSGIGEATARLAAKEGYRLVLAARSKDKLDRLADELGGPDRAVAVACDVTDETAVRGMVGAAHDAFGGIDVVLANAGRGLDTGDAEDWRRMIELNVFGVVMTVKAVMEDLKQRDGHVVLLGSSAGRRPLPGSIYGATKWAITGYGYNLREELKGSGVRSTLIEPGMVDTPFFDSPKPDAMHADDVAEAILFAVSRPARVNINEIWLTPKDG